MMNMPNSACFGFLVAAAVTGAVALSTATAYAADNEKCYGVAKAGKNDCKTDAHSCAGMSKMDRDPASFIAVPAGSCEKIAGGSTSAPMKK
jgi:uncharacterized membrane protein